MPRLLVTNCSHDPDAAGIYLLETRTGDVKRVLTHPIRGVTSTPAGIFAVGNKGTIYHLDPAKWVSRQVADLKFDGSHDLRWINGEFFLVASLGNLVIRFDTDFRELDRMKIVDDDGDVCHANCLVQMDGDLLLSIFTLSPGRREEKRHGLPWRTEGKILRLDWEKKQFSIAYQPLSQPHSLVPQGSDLYLCESFTSEISRVSLSTGTKDVAKKEAGFVRGLAFSGGLAYAGVSRVRARRNFLQKMQGLFHMRCGVVEFDPASWKVRRRFKLPGSETYEILPLEDL